jgi:tetratricopeptide (TPR) repeat protein
MQNKELEHLLREGIAAAQAGHKDQARQLLLQVIALDKKVEAAWLWLSEVVEDPHERQICLENVLTLNPGNAAAQSGLQWLQEQGIVSLAGQTPPALPQPEDSTGQGSGRVPDIPLQPAPARPASQVEIDPFGCPYCGGPVGGEGPRCEHCGRLVEIRQRKRPGWGSSGWLLVLILMLGAVAWLQGYFVSQAGTIDQLPEWTRRIGLQLVVGPALYNPEGIEDELADAARVLTSFDYLLAGLSAVAAAGLALKLRLAYFGSFLLMGLMVLATGVGLLIGFLGLLPALLRLGLVALTTRWLAESSSIFEWQTRPYSASLDPDLRTDLDYYSRGKRYSEMGMWAKAAAHWQVAVLLAPAKVPYRVALASAYRRMDYTAAARAEVEQALELAPDDIELQAFRSSLATLEAKR